MNPKTIIPLLFAAIASAGRLSERGLTCLEKCYLEKPVCQNGMFPLQSATGPCWSCCKSDITVCTQVCFPEPPTCNDGFLPTKNGECYTCCRAPPPTTKPEVATPLPAVTPRSEVCDRQCAPSPPTCGGNRVPFQPGGGSCWACCDPASLPSANPEPKRCDRSCFPEPPQCGEGQIPWSKNGVCWSCCDDPSSA